MNLFFGKAEGDEQFDKAVYQLKGAYFTVGGNEAGNLCVCSHAVHVEGDEYLICVVALCDGSEGFIEVFYIFKLFFSLCKSFEPVDRACK